MVLTEIKRLQDKIKVYEYLLDCLNVKLFYLTSKRSHNEFHDNENRIQVARTSHMIEIQKAKLYFLHGEFKLMTEMLKEEHG